MSRSRTVAERAGVGIATVYRRFPTRDDLIAACFEHASRSTRDAAEEALEAPDGWSGFPAYVERICAMQAADRGLKDVLTRTFPDAERARGPPGSRLRSYPSASSNAPRRRGSLRPDLVPEDLVLLLMANAGVVQGMGTAAPDGPPRFVALLLDGVRSEGASELPPPPSPRQVCGRCAASAVGALPRSRVRRPGLLRTEAAAQGGSGKQPSAVPVRIEGQDADHVAGPDDAHPSPVDRVAGRAPQRPPPGCPAAPLGPAGPGRSTMPLAPSA